MQNMIPIYGSLGCKTIPYSWTHTFIAYIWEYPTSLGHILNTHFSVSSGNQNPEKTMFWRVLISDHETC